MPGIEHPLLGKPRRDVAVATVIGLATAALFILMAFHQTRAPIQRVDASFLRRMIAIRSGALTKTAKALNTIGLVYVTLPIRLLIAGFLAVRRRWWHLVAFATAIVLSEISVTTLKHLYDRARPPGSLVATSGASFPSGHAIAATVTVVAAVIALCPEGSRRYAWGAAAVVFAILMGASRAYLAAHWLSDAIAGVLLGTSFALITALVVHFIREGRARAPSPTPPERSVEPIGT